MSKEWAVEWWNEHLSDHAGTYEDRVRAFAAEAERRGMLKAAGICRQMDDELLAAAIERACQPGVDAKGEG